MRAAGRLQQLASHVISSASSVAAAAAEHESTEAAAAAAGDTPPPPPGYHDLVTLFLEYRSFQQGVFDAEVPDFTSEGVAAQLAALRDFQARLLEVEPALTRWPVTNQVDYHLVRAELNALDFRHRVMVPWLKDPGCYVDLIPSVRTPTSLPLPPEAAAAVEKRLGAVRGVVAQAQHNLRALDGVAADLGTLAVYRLREQLSSLAELAAVDGLARHHSGLAAAAVDARAAVGHYVEWIETNKPQMKAAAGCGKENYDWLLKQVYYVPHTFDEVCRGTLGGKAATHIQLSMSFF